MPCWEHWRVMLSFEREREHGGESGLGDNTINSAFCILNLWLWQIIEAEIAVRQLEILVRVEEDMRKEKGSPGYHRCNKATAGQNRRSDCQKKKHTGDN